MLTRDRSALEERRRGGATRTALDSGTDGRLPSILIATAAAGWVAGWRPVGSGGRAVARAGRTGGPPSGGGGGATGASRVRSKVIFFGGFLITAAYVIPASVLEWPRSDFGIFFSPFSPSIDPCYSWIRRTCLLS